MFQYKLKMYHCFMLGKSGKIIIYNIKYHPLYLLSLTREHFLRGMQLIDKSSPWSQLWIPHPLWIQSSILVSDPEHLMSSIHIGPDPWPYLAQQWASEKVLQGCKFLNINILVRSLISNNFLLNKKYAFKWYLNIFLIL